MFSITLKAAFVVLLVLSMSHLALAEGDCAGDSISGETIDVTNGAPICHIDNDNDKVHLSASAMDYDDTTPYECNCSTGNRIDLGATQWAWSSGVCDSPTGRTNEWKAGTNPGEYTVTANFHDLDDGAACDDDSESASITVTAFKVGMHLAVTGGGSTTVWEDSTTPYIQGFNGDLSLYRILNHPTAPETDGDNSMATWTLETSPDGAAMKRHIHGKARAWGGYDSGEPFDGIKAETHDSDWDVGGGGLASVSISVTAGLVSVGITLNLTGDDNLATCGAAIGFGSELHDDHTSCKVELVSETTTGPTANVPITHKPDDKWLIGKEGASKQAEWEMEYKMQQKEDGSDWAGASVEMDIGYKWSIIDLPFYGT